MESGDDCTDCTEWRNANCNQAGPVDLRMAKETTLGEIGGMLEGLGRRLDDERKWRSRRSDDRASAMLRKRNRSFMVQKGGVRDSTESVELLLR